MLNNSKEFKYRVTEVEKTTAPEGMTGDNWYRYVIQKGNSIMECKKSGTLKAVTVHAKNAADLINARNVRGSQKKK
jgi:hypothetical protein